ncbi:MAG: hypothetical protein QM784_38190 [Polyangiaceae bacterium]
MRNRMNLNVVMAVSALGFAMVASPAMALPCNLTPPPECSSARDKTGYAAGLYMGSALVDQIWRSPAVGQNMDNWDILNHQVTTTIPTIVANAYQAGYSQYTKCRVQGLLDGTVCKMNTIDPVPGCQLDGVDWGSISAGIYCALSIELGGLTDVAPWFIRVSPGMCGNGFQQYCEDTYRYGATAGDDPFSPAVAAFLDAEGVSQASLLQPEECRAYTTATFASVFNHSVYIDCSYTIPEQP